MFRGRPIRPRFYDSFAGNLAYSKVWRLAPVTSDSLAEKRPQKMRFIRAEEDPFGDVSCDTNLAFLSPQ